MQHELARRTLLHLAAGLSLAGSVPLARPRADAKKPAPTGKKGDFDFLTGEWKIHHRWYDGAQWLEFDGEATVHGLLEGLGSIEELRIPARNFFGLGLRLLDTQQKLWADYWIPGETGVLEPSPAWGSFVDGVGHWDGDDQEGEQKRIQRGCWDRITKKSCRWFSATSRDDGATWQENWVMDWQRVK